MERVNSRVRKLIVFWGLLSIAASVGARSDSGTVYVGAVEGVINSQSAAYLDRVVSAAEEARASAVLIELDTPGGLATAMMDMTKTIMASGVPVIVYVTPAGARAASAGMFITISADIAAMAPGTHIGAATPLDMFGGDRDETRRYKVVQSYASAARAIAAKRGRNEDWVDHAVRYSYSATDREALKLKVIDLVASDNADLLGKIDGRDLRMTGRTITLRTRDARLVQVPMTFLEQLVHVITDPNIAYLLMILGILGIAAEFYHPGIYFPGIAGAISLALCFVGFGALPISWGGVGLILLAFGLMIAEMHAPGFGGLGVGALAAFVIGSVLLFSPFGPSSPTAPAVRVSPWLIGAMTAAFAVFFVVVVRKLLQSRRKPVVTGMEAMVGKRGRAVTNLGPRGTVFIDSESWTAESVGGSISKGGDVEVVGVSGVILQVRAVGSSQRAASEAGQGA